MKAERWQEIEVVLHEALDRPPLQRASFLETACAGDDELKAEATTLIAAYEEAGDIIEQPAMAIRVAGKNARVRLIIHGYRMDSFSGLLFNGCLLNFTRPLRPGPIFSTVLTT